MPSSTTSQVLISVLAGLHTGTREGDRVETGGLENGDGHVLPSCHAGRSFTARSRSKLYLRGIRSWTYILHLLWRLSLLTLTFFNPDHSRLWFICYQSHHSYYHDYHHRST